MDVKTFHTIRRLLRRVRRHVTAPISLFLVVNLGCSQNGPFLQRQTMMGALKTNVAQLESEKAQLSKQLADLKLENRRVENELAGLEEKNGDLAARLDDARTLISRQGLEDKLQDSGSSSAMGQERDPARRSTPARLQPGNRKAPFAQIPSERRSILDESNEDDPLELPPPRRRNPSVNDQSRLDNQSPWLPVARGGAVSR